MLETEHLLEEIHELRTALEPFASIKADDGDDFSTYAPETLIRVECSVAEILAARKALAFT